MNLKELATQLAGIKLIESAAKVAAEKLRVEFQERLLEVGADSARAEINGQEIGKVSLTVPKPLPNVVDEERFTKWVYERFQDEIEYSVREAFRKKLLGELKEVGGKAVDTNGELVDGVIFRQRDPYVTTRFNGEGKAIVMKALRESDSLINHIIDLSEADQKEVEK
jgi:hypothetical protein